MAKSKPLTETLNLGKTLANLFLKQGRSDQTVTWMAHYLSELIIHAEQETNAIKKKELEKECAEIILGLWEKRNSFPDVIHPLSGLTHAVEVIKAMMDDRSNDLYFTRFEYAESNSIWGNYMKTLRVAIEDSMRIALSAGITLEARERNKILKLHKDYLSEEEREIMDFLEKELEKSDSLVKFVFVTNGKEEKEEPKTKPELMKRVVSKLRALLDKQQAALDTLEKQIEDLGESKGRRRKP
ncbi:MAG TPA: hypothetical protein VK563_19765 [Puia sp.]|nr:hypothetical protein [Puia sp.]